MDSGFKVFMKRFTIWTQTIAGCREDVNPAFRSPHDSTAA